MSEPTHEISPLTTERLQEIRSAWEDEAGADAFAVVLAGTFSHIEHALSDSPTDAPYSELVTKSGGQTVAIMELFGTRRGSQTKLLSIHAGPALWADSALAEASGLAEIYADAFLGVIRRGQKKAEAGRHEIKIFGRDDFLLSVLQTIHTMWSRLDHVEEARTTMEGRWLKVSFNVLPTTPEKGAAQP